MKINAFPNWIQFSYLPYLQSSPSTAEDLTTCVVENRAQKITGCRCCAFGHPFTKFVFPATIALCSLLEFFNCWIKWRSLDKVSEKWGIVVTLSEIYIWCRVRLFKTSQRPQVSANTYVLSSRTQPNTRRSASIIAITTPLDKFTFLKTCIRSNQFVTGRAGAFPHKVSCWRNPKVCKDDPRQVSELLWKNRRSSKLTWKDFVNIYIDNFVENFAK